MVGCSRPRQAGRKVYLCGESACQGENGAAGRLADALGSVAEVAVVGCQHVCSGPLAGVRVGGRLRWIGPVETTEQVRALVSVVRDDGRRPVPVALVPLQRTKPRRTRTQAATGPRGPDAPAERPRPARPR